jgi:rare lipoprotein A
MRYVVLAALAALTLGLVDARPASAAWSCIGPEVACGGPSATPKKFGNKARMAQHAVKPRKVALHKAKHHNAGGTSSVASSGSYGGGSVGMASYYSQGTRTASGAAFNPGGMTAAHRSLPFGTRVLVTHLASGRSVTVTINDRGPFVRGRIIDLSRGAAMALGITGAGVAKVQVAVLGRG